VAAYWREERDRWQEVRRISVSTVTRCARFRQRHTDASCHRYSVQCTWTSALRRQTTQTHAGNCDVINDGARDRSLTTRNFKGSCRRVGSAQSAVAVQGRAITYSASFTACNETYCGLMSFLDTWRNLILDHQKIIRDSSLWRLVNTPNCTHICRVSLFDFYRLICYYSISHNARRSTVNVHKIDSGR